MKHLISFLFLPVFCFLFTRAYAQAERGPCSRLKTDCKLTVDTQNLENSKEVTEEKMGEYLRAISPVNLPVSFFEIPVHYTVYDYSAYVSEPPITGADNAIITAENSVGPIRNNKGDNI